MGIVISAVSYTAAIALSDGGFDNWDWGDFGKNVAIGVVSSVASWGVGTAFTTAGNVAGTATTTATTSKIVPIVARAAVHAYVQGIIAEFSGGNFGEAFVAGFVGGLVGGIGSGSGKAWVGAKNIAAAMLMSGASAELQGGDFWRGAAVGGIVAGANHFAHNAGASLEKKIQQNRNERAQNGVIKRLTLEQANRHYRNGNRSSLTVEASNIDLSGVDPSQLGPVDGSPVVVNLSTNGSRDGLVYGRLELINRGNGRVEILPNEYDFRTGAQHGNPWFGKGNTFWRNVGTVAGNIVAGPGEPYMIYFNGLGDLNYKPTPFVPQFPTGPK